MSKPVVNTNEHVDVVTDDFAARVALFMTNTPSFPDAPPCQIDVHLDGRLAATHVYFGPQGGSVTSLLPGEWGTEDKRPALERIGALIPMVSGQFASTASDQFRLLAQRVNESAALARQGVGFATNGQSR